MAGTAWLPLDDQPLQHDATRLHSSDTVVTRSLWSNPSLCDHLSSSLRDLYTYNVIYITFSNVNNDLSTPPCVFEMKKKKEKENISANSKQQVESRFDRSINLWMNALTFLDNVNRYIIRKTRDESFIVRSLNRGRTVWPRIVIRGPRANTRADILTTVTGFSQPGWNKNVGVPCSILLMGLETGWSGITQPGIENRFMDSVVSQLQYPDAYRVATDAKKRKRKKGKKCVCTARCVCFAPCFSEC